MTRPSHAPAAAVVAVVAALGLLATGCTFTRGRDPQATPDGTIASRRSDGSGTPTDTYPAVTLRWKDCTEPELDGLQCSALAVPLDHRRPDGPTIDLAISRRPADGKKPIGSLVVNPGGPGASGRDLVGQLDAALSEEVLDRFDLVGFDPRGVGASSPVRCVDGPGRDALVALDGDPDNPAEVGAYVEAQQAFAAACTSRYKQLLPHLGTEDAARDLDRLRAALGDRALTYLGYSYGTELGATYATLFPRRVRAMVLDGAVAPDASGLELSLEQAKGFELAFDNFVAACARDSACAARPDAEAMYQAVRTKVEAAPIPVKEGSERRSLAVGAFQTAVIGALYDESLWTFLARGLVEARDGNGATLLALADLYTDRRSDGSFTNVSDANTAITCADDAERPTRQEAEQYARQFATGSPRFGAQLGWMSLSCLGMPVSGQDPVRIAAPDAPPLLVIGTVGDPATPYPWAGQLAGALGSATLLTWEGEGHTAYPKTSCITAAVDAYLLRLEVPATGTRCPAGDTDDTGPFGALAEELRKGLDGSGLSPAVTDCVARQVAEQITVRELIDAQTAAPASVQRKVAAAALACARSTGG